MPHFPAIVLDSSLQLVVLITDSLHVAGTLLTRVPHDSLIQHKFLLRDLLQSPRDLITDLFQLSSH